MRVFGAEFPGLPVGRDVLSEGHEVGDAEQIDGAGKARWREGGADQRRIAAIARAIDRHARGLGDALTHGPVDGIEQVGMYAARPFAVAGIDERLAEAGRASVVHAQHVVAAVGEPLVRGAEVGHVARPRAAMDQQYHRAGPACLGIARPRQVADELQSIARGDEHRLHRHQRGIVERRPGREQAAHRAGRAVVAQVAARARRRARRRS